jgi:hypothetical protein
MAGFLDGVMLSIYRLKLNARITGDPARLRLCGGAGGAI